MRGLEAVFLGRHLFPRRSRCGRGRSGLFEIDIRGRSGLGDVGVILRWGSRLADSRVHQTNQTLKVQGFKIMFFFSKILITVEGHFPVKMPPPNVDISRNVFLPPGLVGFLLLLLLVLPQFFLHFFELLLHMLLFFLPSKKEFVV